jgi:hypothetical protein
VLQLLMILLRPCKLRDLPGQGLGPELQPVSLQGLAQCRLHVQLQVLLIVMEPRPVGQVPTVGVPVDTTSQ